METEKISMKEINQRLELAKDKLNQVEENSKKEEFYEVEILPLLREKFREAESKKVQDPYDVLITSVGSSYEPIVLSIEAVKPSKIYFLHTSQSEENVEKIFKTLNLKLTQMEREEVDHVDPSLIYNAIKKICQKHSDGRIAVDITGGTKSMSSGMAMAGGMIGADLIYISSKMDRNSTFRKPIPGTEELNFLPNPYELFGDIELKRAQKLWKQGEYFAAAELLQQVANKLPEQYEYEVLSKLAEAYFAWESLDLQLAKKNFEWILGEGKLHLDRMRNQLLNEEDFKKITKQLEIASMLAEHFTETAPSLDTLANREFMEHVILYLYSISIKRKEQNKLDVAALYMYRMVEVLFQHKLAQHGIITATPDYTNLSLSPEELVTKVNDLLKKYKIKQSWKEMPSHLALSDSHLLLSVLNDPTAGSINNSRLKNAAKARNNSILAHGYLVIDEKLFNTLAEPAKDLLHKFLDEKQRDIEEVIPNYQLLIPSSFQGR